MRRNQKPYYKGGSVSIMRRMFEELPGEESNDWSWVGLCLFIIWPYLSISFWDDTPIRDASEPGIFIVSSTRKWNWNPVLISFSKLFFKTELFLIADLWFPLYVADLTSNNRWSSGIGQKSESKPFGKKFFIWI